MVFKAQAVVIDTNVFVAAGFKPGRDSARILAAVRDGRLRMIWNAATRRETRAILQKIPPLSWPAFEDLFRPEAEHTGEVQPERFRQIPDPADRKFAGLAHATGAVLISQDEDLLDRPHRIAVLVLTPSEFLADSPYASGLSSP